MGKSTPNPTVRHKMLISHCMFAMYLCIAVLELLIALYAGLQKQRPTTFLKLLEQAIACYSSNRTPHLHMQNDFVATQRAPADCSCRFFFWFSIILCCTVVPVTRHIVVMQAWHPCKQKKA